MIKTVALYISSASKGGAERVVMNLAEYFCQEGYRVLLVTTRVVKEEYPLPEGVERIISEPGPRELSGGRIANFTARFCKLRGIWKKERPDVILSFIGKNNMMAILTAAGLKIPVAVSVRGEPTEEYYNRWLRLMAKGLFCFASGVILQTKRCYDFFPKAVRKKAVTLRNPVHANFFRERFEGEREKTIVAVGRIDENKNHKLLIEAFGGIAGKFPEYRLVIYGEGEKRKELRELSAALGLEDRIFLPGNVDNVAELIYKAQVFVLPSNTEGMPNTLLEAMLLGLTVISTDCPCGGPAELIRHGTNGLLIPAGDVKKMEEALELVLGDLRRADEMGREAAKLKEEYKAEKVYESWKRYLEKLAGE
ncbi:MAG: glycosyltransferase [Clostridium sp.]|nr:glycosyltransferase [Clostridium sp.]